jgi:uncharacterized membrane protein
MTFDPILNAPLPIQIHVASAICAVVLGPIVLWRRSRDIWHRRLGYAWVTAMLMTALSSFLISDEPVIGSFSPIHGLSVFTIYGLWQGISAARARDIAAHQGHMRGLYFWAMGVAGLFTFLPGRRMNTVFFSDYPTVGFTAVAVVIGGGLAAYAITQRRHAI